VGGDRRHGLGPRPRFEEESHSHRPHSGIDSKACRGGYLEIEYLIKSIKCAHYSAIVTFLRPLLVRMIFESFQRIT